MPLISFAHTWPLWLLASVPLLWWLTRTHRTGLSRRRMALASALRAGAVTLACLALAGPSLTIVANGISVVYALDISRSVAPEFVQTALNWIEDANARYRPAQARYVVFADRARLMGTAREMVSVEVMTGNDSTGTDGDFTLEGAVDQGATNIESGLLASLYGFSRNQAKRLVLLTDGNQTEGDLWRALPRLKSENIRVFTIPAAVAADNDAWIESVTAPESIRQREPTAIAVRVISRSATRARVELKNGDTALGTQSLLLSPGENILSFPVQFRTAGANVVTVQVVADADQLPANDMLSETLWVRPPPKVLYVEADPQRAIYLADALTRQGIDLSVATVEDFVTDAGILEGKDGIILSDIRASDIDEPTGRRLEVFVRDTGGGLIFAAGENTYGKDGFAKSALERLLPVKFEGKRKKLELDLVLLIDRSHSMRGQKLELAKSAALATLELLERDHRLAVVAFDANAHDVVPLARVGSKRRAEDLIRSMTSSGQTNIFNGLAHAHRILEKSHAKTKHIILLSDGNTAPPPGAAVESSSEKAMEMIRKLREDAMRRANAPIESATVAEVPQGGYPELLEKLVTAKITLTTVAIGDKPNVELMADLAASANGKSYVAERDVEIPGLFVAETRRLLGESIVEVPFRPIVKSSAPAIDGVDFSAGPQLRGYVVGTSKRFGDVLLEARNDQPLLTETRYGLGKTVAFLSDVKNRWAADWIDWPGYAQLWGQILRDSARRDVGSEIRWRVTREGREAVCSLAVFAADGAYRNGLSPKVRMVAPDGNSSVAQLRQVAPGRYEARVALPTSSASPYRFELVETPGISKQELARAGVRSVIYPYPDEYRIYPPNIDLLKAISDQTGGKFAPKTAEIFADLGDRSIASVPLWRHLAAAALMLFLLDIGVRRVPWRARSGRAA